MDDDSQNQTKWPLTYLALAGLPYCIFVGLCYLWGYWSIFNINILQYAGATDVAASAAYPIVVGLTFLLIGSVSGQTFAQRNHNRVADSLPEPARVRNILRRHAGAISGIYTVASLLFMTYAGPIRWQIFPFLIALPAAILFVGKGWIAINGVSKYAQAMLCFALVFFPCSGFGIGKLDGEAILKGKYFMYLHSSEGGPRVSTTSTPTAALRFLGHAGDFDFFYDPTNETVSISKTQDESILVFKKFRNPILIKAGFWDVITELFTQR